MLYALPPERFPFYPPCPIHLYTGLLCPGCGATRAIAALLHGNLSGAFRLNALFVLLLPGILVYGASALRRAWRGQAPHSLPRFALAGLFLAAAVFTVGRNIL